MNITMFITEVINEIFSSVVYHYIAAKTHDKNYCLQCFDVNVYIHSCSKSLYTGINAQDLTKGLHDI